MSKQNTLVNIPLQQTSVYLIKEENVYNEESNQDFQQLPKIWIPLYYITLLFILAGVISLICLFCVDLTHITFNVRKYADLETDTNICEDGCKAIDDTFINQANSMMWSYHPPEWNILENQIYDTVALAEPFTQKSCTADKENNRITVVTASQSQPELVTSPTFTIYCWDNKKSVSGVYHYDYTSRIGSYKPKGGARIKRKDYVTEKEEYPYALSCLIITLIPFVMFAIATMCVTFRLRTTSNYNIRRREGCCFCGKNDLSGHVHRLIVAVIVLQITIIVLVPFLFLITAFALWNSPLYETYNANVEDAGVFLKVVIFQYVCQFVALIGVCLIHYFKLW